MKMEFSVDFAAVPAIGTRQLILRCRGEDKVSIDHAAAKLGMNQAQFIRTVCVLGARAVLEAMGGERPVDESPKLFNNRPPGVIE